MIYRLALIVLMALPSAMSKTVFKDVFVFRTGNNVFSLSDLQDYSNYLKDFSCFYPDTLAGEFYSKLAKAPPDFFKVETFGKQSKKRSYSNITEKFVAMMKLIRYASSQSVSVSSQLPKAFMVSAKRNNCSLRGFKEEDMKKQMKDIALLEIFLRSRFAPEEEASISGKKRKNVLSNIRSLEDSVKNQIDHELFEN